MVEEMPSGFDQPQESMDTVEMASVDDRLMVTDANAGVAGPSGVAMGHLSSSRRASSQNSSNLDEDAHEEDEEDDPEDDPDWSGDHEDPDDPEWTGREELPGATSVSLAPQPKNNSKKPSASSKTIHK